MEAEAPAGRRSQSQSQVDPRRLGDLERAERHRAVLRTVLSLLLAWVVIFGAYFVNPIGLRSGSLAFTRLGADIALVAAVVAWQVRRIQAADLPELRAAPALGIIIAWFLAVFSGLYLGLSNSLPRDFSTPLDHVRALYFTITVFSTVGFGDITPRTDSARLIVAAQMLLDLALIGAVVRLLFNAARSRVGTGAREVGDSPS
jgi:voltage-gated potassium channel